MDKPAVLIRTRPSLRRAYFYAFIYVLFLAYGRITHPDLDVVWFALFGVLLLILAFAHLSRFCTQYTITGDEVQVRSGILARHAAVIHLQRITNVEAKQSFLERILGLVTLCIDSAGGSEKEATLRRILKIDATHFARIIREETLRLTGAAPRTSASAAE